MLSDKKKKDREKRGEITQKDLQPYLNCSSDQLLILLNDSEAKKRTIAATILGKNHSNKFVIEMLCLSFKKEKALYSRIAISEALSNIGKSSVPYLVNLLGKIGSNQEKSLPEKYFNKKSYPLARDMAARTLVKIGNPATPYLIDVLEDGDDFEIQQALDALGGIAAKTSDHRALNSILKLVHTHNMDSLNEVTLWKVCRCLSGFKGSEKASRVLVDIIKTNPEDPIVWESVRSLGYIGITSMDINRLIENRANYEHPEIQKAVKNALAMINYI
ncbi:HEAT repeat domain-containing protein [Methanobacterium alcaliphilum]|uniref:HEAT repeat domain-containing protein n=1 Tax=Methanobacterium alcaliphilum TaxID=392018 RepID=UPI00200B6C6E|nr:HEAT repeat domain-containing protein [Methanobacterium alcaliphilum]MCK9152105.1 HEAT repeat domain-containing protein [Methanobacterium alcaliphilum]